MPKAFPTDAKTQFLICENVRQEAAGKLSLMGFTASSNLLLNQSSVPTPNAPTSITLALLFIFTDGEGTFDGWIEIKNPKGESVGKADMKELVKTADKPHVAYTNIAVLPISMLGNFSVILTLDDTKEYRRDFSVTLPATATSIPT